MQLLLLGCFKLYVRVRMPCVRACRVCVRARACERWVFPETRLCCNAQTISYHLSFDFQRVTVSQQIFILFQLQTCRFIYILLCIVGSSRIATDLYSAFLSTFRVVTGGTLHPVWIVLLDVYIANVTFLSTFSSQHFPLISFQTGCHSSVHIYIINSTLVLFKHFHKLIFSPPVS